MQENARPEQEKELTPKQEQLIIELVSGKSIRDACKIVVINEVTAYRWLKQPLFQEAYQAAKKIAYDETLEDLRGCTREAIDTLKSNLKALEPSVQVRAAHIILTQSMQVHKIEAVAQRVIELEEKVKALQK
jgi:hypothetical protein